MKKYISPIAKSIKLNYEGLIAASSDGGLDNGDNVGNQKPRDDDDENFFSNRRNSVSIR